MANSLNAPAKKAPPKVKIWTRLSIPILLVVIFQILTYSAVLIFGGEFRNIREYAYSTLEEKTEYRSSYIRNDFRQKPILVQEYAEQINNVVDELLTRRGASISDLWKNKALSHVILDACAEHVVSLLRHAVVNDAYLILETGVLFAGEGGRPGKAALYLRDLDPYSGSGYSDLLMELGPTSVYLKYGIIQNSGWSPYFTPNPNDPNKADFYDKTMRVALENSGVSQSFLGYWSGFSRPSSMAQPSLKYTLPLIAQDGTVYGVLGIGIMESAVVSNIPSNDFLSGTACYVLGHSTSDNHFDIVTHSGSAFGTLVGNTDTLYIGDKLEKDQDIYGFDMQSDVDLVGSVQYIGLYNQASPYAGEQWALISVADKSSVLHPVTFLSQMLMVSALASLIVAAIVAIPSCTGFIRPITAAIRLMKAKRKFNEVIHFQPSNIYEIDEMTDAITQLQINVQDVSSEVSKMISIADVGLGTFRYDRTDDSVLVGQSLIKMLKLQVPQDEDIVMTREEFLGSIRNRDAWSAIVSGLQMVKGETQEDYSKVYQLNAENGAVRWMRLSYTYSPSSAIGIVQDVTDTMLEKQRIEYERDYDTLTGLMNRHAYYRRIEELFHDKSKLKTTAFIMLDLDNLKYVNDTYGHDFGDDYIKTAARVLREFENYGGLVARISGDEFNICLPGFSSKDEVRKIIDRVRSKLLQSSCLLADGTHFKLRASLGMSWYPDDADTYELLMKYADFAMYTIKHSTKGNIAEFDMSSYSADSVLLTGVEEMNRIIEKRSVRYAFQSIVSAKTGEIYGYEALMRVQSKIFQSPPELLRTAKTGAKLYEIERLTWSKALEDFKAMIDAGLIGETAHIFINSIANCELEHADMQVIEASYANLMPRVVLEILENESANETYTAHKKAYMKKRNAKIALDDFGTGYNSEYALLSIQPNIVKIDRSIINGCDKDVSRRMIISNLVKLAQTKEILVIAEGVESQEEMKTVISCGVDLLQGYYLSHPLFEPEPIAPEIVKLIQDLNNPGSEPDDDDWSFNY